MAYVKDIDRGWAKLMTEMRQLDGAAVSVGIQADAPPEANGANMAVVAAVQEFGSPEHNIPARSFIRATADRTADTLPKVINAFFGTLLAGGKALTFMKSVGDWYEAEMKVTLLKGPWAPNALATVKRKKSETPLVDKGRLKDAIRYALVRRGG